MANVFLLLAMTLVLPHGSALTTTEISQFTARPVRETNTGEQGTVSVTREGDYFRIVSNGIPDHKTGTFPASTNPNEIETQKFSLRFSANPQVAAAATCLPNGPIAFTKNGVPLFSPFNVNGENAVEGEHAETFDSCDGHPDMMHVYHYHQTPDCVYSGGNDEFIGVALDGFAIYGIKDAAGKEVTSKDLDNCHGRVEKGFYRYRLTRDYPYIMGCFSGKPSPDIDAKRLAESSCRFAGAQANFNALSGPLMIMIALSLRLFY